jgi:hypothetical protein
MRAGQGEGAMRPTEPLTPGDMQGLWRWERQVTWLYGTSMAALLLSGMAASRFGDYAWLQRPLLVAFAGLLTAAAVLQFLARCPRCGTRLRSGVLKLIPDKCVACGVEFPRPRKS